MNHCLLLLLLLCNPADVVGEEDQLSITRGREIYLAGTSDGPEIKMVLANADLEMPATSFPCASCHGEDGRGTREGGLVPPPIRWQDLNQPAQVELTGRKRSAFTLDAIRKAISDGIDPDGVALHPGMPRYKMTSNQFDDLEAYLKVLGKEEVLDAGVKPDILRLGTVIPLTGTRAFTGVSIKEALQAWSQQVSERGIYGRSIEWVFEDTESTAAGTLAALERVIDQDVFALVSCHIPPDTSGVEELLARKQIPMVGPVMATPRPADPPFPWIYYLLPSTYHQARAMVEYICAKDLSSTPTIALVSQGGPHFEGAHAGIIEQLGVFGVKPVLEIAPAVGHFDPIRISNALQDSNADHVVVLATGSKTVQLCHRLDALDSKLEVFTIGSELGRDAFLLPDSIGARTFITYPSVVDRRKSDLTWLLYLARDTGFKIENAAVQGSALAAVVLIQDTIERCGRRLSQKKFIEELEKTQVFRTGLTPPLTFSPARHVGSIGSHVMKINIKESRFEPVSSWLIPRLTANGRKK